MQALRCAQAQEVVAVNGAQVSVPPQGSSTTAPGLTGTVLYAEGRNTSNGVPSTITATSVNIFTIGDEAYGVDAENGAHIALSGSTSNGPFTISTSGNNASGIVARGAGTLVTADSIVFRTSSLRSRGFDAFGGAQVNVSNSDIAVNAASGVDTDGAGTLATIQGGSIVANGVTGNAMAMRNGGTIEASSVIATGMGLYSTALSSDSQGIGVVNMVTIANSTLESTQQGNAIDIHGGTTTITLTNSDVTGATGTVMDV